MMYYYYCRGCRRILERDHAIKGQKSACEFDENTVHKLKSLTTYLNRLPILYRQLLIEILLCPEIEKKHIFIRSASSLRQLLMCFDWIYTKQGFAFWEAIYNETKHRDL